MAEVVVRVAIALVSLALVAALAVELRAHDLLADATGVASQSKPSAPSVDAALKDLDSVKKLRPGGQAFLAAAALDLRSGRYAAAARQAAAAARREPKNFSAWVTLAVARGRAGDAAGERAALARAHPLNPLYPIPH